MIHTGLSVFLVFLLFQDRFVSTKMNRDIFVLLAVIVFGFAMVKDVSVALMVAVISYVVISKIEVNEKFDSKTAKDQKEKKEKKENTSKPALKVTKSVDEPKSVKEVKKVKEVKASAAVPVLPEHCKNVAIRDDVILGLEKGVDEYQSNVFDKFNMEVFYHEAGSNSMDIQGIFNHEVRGYEQ